MRLKSLIISGIAGKSIVSPNIVTKSAEPNTMRVIHAEPGIFTDVDVLLPLLSSGDEGVIGVSAKYIRSQSLKISLILVLVLFHLQFWFHNMSCHSF